MTRRAICVGVYEQDHESLDPIAHCARDLDAMESLLASTECGFEVHRIDNPSSSNLLDQLWDGLEGLGRQDELLVYFTGHGRRNKARHLQLCTRNTKSTRLIPTSIGFDNLLTAIEECEVGAILVVLDCCFAGAAAETIFKGEDDVLAPHEKAIKASKGLAVLCSSSAVETSRAERDEMLSLFTHALLEICRSQIKDAQGWVSIGELYDELRRALFAHSPRLLGDNPAFRVLCGSRGRQPQQEPEIELDPIPPGQPTFCGMLVGDGFRTWLVAMLDTAFPAESKKIAKNVYALFNPVELYREKIKSAQAALTQVRGQLENLARSAGAPLLLVHPISIEPLVFNRLQGVDRTYILTTSRALEPRTFPPVISKGVHVIMFDEHGAHVLRAPEDYLRDSFGINQEETWADGKMVVRLSQDTFRHNAKHLAIDAKTSRLEGALTVGKDAEPERLRFESPETTAKVIVEKPSARTGVSLDLRRKVAQALEWTRRTVAKPTPPPPEKAPDKLWDKHIERVRKDKPAPPRKVVTERRISTGKSNPDPNCALCKGVGFRSIECNLRAYRVPCKRCNRGYDQTWRAFADR